MTDSERAQRNRNPSETRDSELVARLRKEGNRGQPPMGNGCWADLADEAADTIDRLTSTGEAGGVTVKPLEWETVLGRFEALSIFGIYFAYANGSWTSPLTRHHADTGDFASAKAACQAEREARIRGELE